MVELLFQVKNDDFGEEITSKPYPKYVYQIAKKGPKTTEKEAFLEAINGISSNHIYGENPSKRVGYYWFCSKKDTLKDQKEQKSAISQAQKTFQLNQNDLIEIQKKKEPKRIQFRPKQTKWWCFECQKSICKECWSLYH